MATKSIYKNVIIKDARLSRNLVSALENAKKKQSKDVRLSKTCHELKRDQIKGIFGE
jgi:iron(III) transport system ATP-binding protein